MTIKSGRGFRVSALLRHNVGSTVGSSMSEDKDQDAVSMDMLNASEATSISASEVVQRVRAKADGGLSAGEAERRRRIYGYNELVINGDEPIWKKYINQVSPPAAGSDLLVG